MGPFNCNFLTKAGSEVQSQKHVDLADAELTCIGTDFCLAFVFATSISFRITDAGVTRDIWEYTVEHSSSAVSKMETRREAKMVSEVSRQVCA